MSCGIEVLDEWTEIDCASNEHGCKFRIIRNVNGQVYLERWAYDVMAGWHWIIPVDFDVVELALVNRILMLKGANVS